MDQQQVMRITKALADPTRFRILQAIAAGRSCCSELATRFPVTQATCSQHLKVLTDAGLLTMRREAVPAITASCATPWKPTAALSGPLSGCNVPFLNR